MTARGNVTLRYRVVDFIEQATMSQKFTLVAELLDDGGRIIHDDRQQMGVDTFRTLLKSVTEASAVTGVNNSCLTSSNYLVQSDMADAEMNIIAQMHASLVWAVNWIQSRDYPRRVMNSEDMEAFELARTLANSTLEQG